MGLCNIKHRKLCCCSLRTCARVLCLMDLIYKMAAAFIEIMKGRTLAVFLTMLPTFFILVSSFSNDVRLAKLGLTIHNLLTYIFLFFGSISMGLFIYMFDKHSIYEPILKNNEALQDFYDEIVIQFLYLIFFLIGHVISNYYFYNFTKFLTARDWKVMDNDRDLFFYYGDVIENEKKGEIIETNDSKFFCSFTCVGSKNSFITLRSKLQFVAMLDIIFKCLRVVYLGVDESKGEDFFGVMVLTFSSCIAIIGTFNDHYRLTYFTYIFNSISFFLTFFYSIIYICIWFSVLQNYQFFI